MNEDRVDRIHYNINIQHSRAAAGNGFTSPAIFSEVLARPLINNPSEWDVLINKFKIDTFTIPITIVKIREYQPVRTDGKYLTDYNVQVIHNGYVYSAPCYFKPEHQSPDTTPPVVATREDGQVKYDNTHETFFVYSYQHILDMINDAIEEVCAEAGLDGDCPHFGMSNESYLLYFTFGIDFTGHEITGLDVMGIRKYNFATRATQAATMNEEKPVLLFSPNLEEFIGKGFRIKRWPGNNYFYLDPEIAAIQYQEYPTVGNWNICNAILITSSSLPVQPEYYPIHTADGDLIHHHTGGSEYLNMGSLQILAV